MTKSEQPQSVGAILSGLIAERGVTLLNDRRRLLGLLRDKAPGDVRTIRLLMIAFDEGVPQRFKSAQVSEIDVGREVSRLNVNVGITLDLAQDVVLTWASAIGGYAAKRPLLDAGSSQGPKEADSWVVQSDGAPLAAAAPETMSRNAGVLSGNPVADATQTAAAPPAVQPLPSVTPLPPVQPLPGHAGLLASVQPLPAAAPTTAQPPITQPTVLPLPPGNAPPVAPAAPADKWKWIRIAVGTVIILGGILKVVDAYKRSSPAPQQAAPASQPATPAPTPAPEPAQPTARLTPEGLPVLLPDNGPTFKAQRIENNPNSLVIPFGVMIGDQAISYQAAFVFDPNKPNGAGKILAFRGSQQASTDVVQTDHFTSDDKLVIRVFGKMKSNPIGVPPLCVLVHVANRYDIIDISNAGEITVYGLDRKGNCDGNLLYGNGFVR